MSHTVQPALPSDLLCLVLAQLGMKQSKLVPRDLSVVWPPLGG